MPVPRKGDPLPQERTPGLRGRHSQRKLNFYRRQTRAAKFTNNITKYSIYYIKKHPYRRARRGSGPGSAGSCSPPRLYTQRRVLTAWHSLRMAEMEPGYSLSTSPGLLCWTLLLLEVVRTTETELCWDMVPQSGERRHRPEDGGGESRGGTVYRVSVQPPYTSNVQAAPSAPPHHSLGTHTDRLTSPHRAVCDMRGSLYTTQYWGRGHPKHPII